MTRATALLFFLPLVALASCRRQPARQEATLILHAPGGAGVDLTVAQCNPISAVSHAATEGGALALSVDLSTRVDHLVIDVQGACSLSVDLAGLRPGQVIHRAVEPWLTFGGPYAQVGFGAPFTIEVKPGCPQANRGVITWKQIAGLPLDDLHVENRGFRLSARTAERREALPDPLPWGVVPVAPRTRGEALFEATWQDGDRPRVTRELRVAAAARSRGLPNVPIGSRLLLGGRGWRVMEAPAGATAELGVADGATSFEPDVAGLFRLQDDHGRELSIRPARYDETPLDCGRSSCHAGIAAAAQKTPMAASLERLFRGGGDPTCAVPCHTTGESGILDGGFADVARELHFAASSARAWSQLPPPLQRLGGVGCLACHGPGAIPEPSARWTILRSEVCAHCHDAPPRYGHVSAWRASAMATADRDERTRKGRACARCHTSAGFLSSLDARDAHDAHDAHDARDNKRHEPVDRSAPEPMGITCAACHAVHDEHRAADLPPRHLVREVPLPVGISGTDHPREQLAASAICLGCHSATPAEAPAASAASLWFGRGGLDPLTGAEISGPSPHASMAEGCLGCHGGGPGELERGRGHAFRASRAACNTCHAARPSDSDLRVRARADYGKLLARASLDPGAWAVGPPPHATNALRVDTTTPLGRAAFDVLLVLEDPAADVHNPSYARSLLDHAEHVLDHSTTPPKLRGP